MAGLTKSIRRPAKYAIGGIAVVLAFDTFLASGLNAATVTRDVSGAITDIEVDAAAKVVRLEFEENEALFSDNTTIGANKFPKHTLGLKFNGRSTDQNEAIKALDLNRTTHVVKLHGGQCVLLGGQNGLIAEKSDSGAGAKSEDFFGYDVTLSGAELEKAPIVPESVFEVLAALVTT